MPRRLRLGPASGLQVLGMAAAVLVLALVVTGRSLRGGAAPRCCPKP
jgi:hypothetical protein